MERELHLSSALSLNYYTRTIGKGHSHPSLTFILHIDILCENSLSLKSLKTTLHQKSLPLSLWTPVLLLLVLAVSYSRKRVLILPQTLPPAWA